MSVPTQNLEQLIAQLNDVAGTLEKNDLVQLAEMHGLCERIIEMGAASADPTNDLIVVQIQALAAAAEDLIMSTSEDPDAVVATIRRTAAELAADLSPGGAAPASDSADAEAKGISESQNPSSDAATADTDSAPHSAVEGTPEEVPGADLPETVRALIDLAASVETDDLANLAKMHGWCEQTVAEAGESVPQLADAATTVGQLLEGLIIGTSAKAEEDLAAIRVQLDALVQSAAAGMGASSAECETPVGDAAAEAKDSSVEAGPTAPDTAASDTAASDTAASGPTPKAAPAPAAAKPTAPPAAVEKAPVAEEAPPYQAEPLLIDEKEIEFVSAFTEEAGEHIEAIESALLEVESAPDDVDKINELFRPFHTIKGMAGFLNLRDVNCLTHEVETLLDQGRRGDRVISAGVTDLVFEVIDILKSQLASIGAYIQNPNGEVVPQPPVEEMINRLRGVVSGRIELTSKESSTPAASPQPSAAPSSDDSLPAEEASAKESAGQTPPTSPAAVVEQSVRIDTKKLDALVDMVGELVIAHSLIASNQKIVGDPRLSKDAGQVTKIVRDVQEVAMAMRMVPIKSTFQKMARLVRDLSRKAGKNVELTISGEDTEVDKNVIQQIGDPLVHMVRNAVDHGIEMPDQRVEAGKAACGRVSLNAFHQSGNIVIEIRDDGKGLDAEVLRKKAIEKGIISPEDELTDEQAYPLIFAPGFSTAAVITDISGRGVGMDVVKRNIEALRGRVDIASQKQRGSTFSIRLPLTLAIIDGMLVRLGDERVIIPTTSIEQALRPVASQINTVQNRGEVLTVRGQLIPLVQLGQLFKLTRRVEPSEGMVVIVHVDGRRIGLVVEELIGQQQVVIKSLGERLRGIKGISGAAILGDGRIGLILDVAGVCAANDGWRHSDRVTRGASPIDGATRSAIEEDLGQVDAAVTEDRPVGEELEADVSEPVLA